MVFKSIDASNYKDVANIYALGIATGNATFETTVPNFTEWDEKHLPFGRIALYNSTQMLGWAALSKVSYRAAYSGVAELSIYITPNMHGKGIGTLILQQLIVESEQHNIWTLQCGIMRENMASILLHKKCGFREIGYREKIGILHGVWRDNVLMERRSAIIGIN